MDAPPNLLNLFVEPTGALLYFLAVFILSQAALFMALGQRLRGNQERAAGRYALASFGVVIAWIALMVGALVVLLTRTPSGAVLPPLDRAVSTLIVLIVGWAFVTADSPAGEGFLNALFVVLALAVVAGFVYTETQWIPGPAVMGFNDSPLGLAWTIIPLAATALGVILTFLRARQSLDIPLKLIFFGLLAAGFGFTLYSIAAGMLKGDDSGAIRLAFLAAMPFLPIIVYRLVVERLTQAAEANLRVRLPATPSAEPVSTTAERESVALLKALGLMIEKEVPDDLPQQIVVAVAATLKADVAALLALDDAEYADVIAAFDNIQQKPIAAMALKLDEQPTLAAALQDKAQRALQTDRNLNELVDLYTRLDIQRLGPAYFQPLTRDGVVIAALVIALPYTQRELRENETSLLAALAPIAARLLSISRAAQRARAESSSRAVQAVVEGTQPEAQSTPVRQEMQASLELARQQINDLGTMVRDLQIELDYERSRLAQLSGNDAEGLSITQQLEALAAERTQLANERERLAQALQEAQTRMLGITASDDDDVYATMVDVLQKERDELQTQKAQLEAQLAEIRKRGAAPAPAVLRRVLTNLSEEKSRLLVERNQIAGQLSEVQEQLKALGIEGPGGLARMLARLTEERGYYKALAEKTAQDRDVLLAERQRLSDQIAHEAEREAKIAAMEDALRRLAQDREALSSQRDALRQSREGQSADYEKWVAQRTRLLAEVEGLQAELEEAVFGRDQALAERAALEKERDQLAAQRTALQTERDQLAAATEGNREMLQRLGADGVDALKTMIDDLTEERSELEHQLMKTQAQVRTLEEQLQKAKGTLARSIPLPTSAAVDASQAEVMLSIAQELRTPMSSIGGYVDLLLGESVGILGALQRQFLQRVKANADRLGNLLEDFIRVTAIDTGQLHLQPVSVDMIEVIDDAITATRTQFREKGITLKMDLPDSLPPLRADRDALQQIVIQLLSNAYLASPTDGEVAITARREPHFALSPRNGGRPEVTDVILIAVRDQGGGIPSEEQVRVFSRLYRADNPLIQGLGDTGVGLSIARALTEVHGGRIWLESQQGVGSTFKLVLPLQPAVHTEQAQYATS